MAEEDVVAKHERNLIAADEVCTYEKCLRQSLRPLLACVGDADAPLRSVVEQPLELAEVLGGRDDQNVPDASQH
jgi:hypothetical protein